MKKGRTVLQAKRLGIYSCGPNTSLLAAIRLMVDEDISGLVVVDNNGYLRGIIRRADVLKAHLEHDNWATLPVKDFMHSDVPVVTPSTMLGDAARLLLSHPMEQVVVALPEGNELRPVAMLTDGDLAYHLVKAD